MGKPDSTDRKERRRKIADDNWKCDRCKPHDGENRGRRPRSDKHKTDRKGR